MKVFKASILVWDPVVNEPVTDSNEANLALIEPVSTADAVIFNLAIWADCDNEVTSLSVA